MIFRDYGYEEIRPGVFKVPLDLYEEWLEIRIVDDRRADIYHHDYRVSERPLRKKKNRVDLELIYHISDGLDLYKEIYETPVHKGVFFDDCMDVIIDFIVRHDRELSRE